MLIQHSANRFIRSCYGFIVALAATAIGGMGCATSSVAHAPIHRPGPGGSGSYSTLTPGELAFGHQSASANVGSPVNSSLGDLDSFLLKSERSTHKAVHPRPVRATLAALEPTPAPSQGESLLPQATDPAASLPVPSAPKADTASPAAQNTPDAQLYAARETQSKQQQDYRGGDVLIISASTVLIVLLIVLLIFLLR